MCDASTVISEEKHEQNEHISYGTRIHASEPARNASSEIKHLMKPFFIEI
jgi:hypothetical protein